MSIFSRFPGIFSTSIGIDLGTANVLVYVKGRGIIMDEPSYVAMNKETKAILAVGSDAKRMATVVPEGLEVIRPMKEGVIADYEISEHMLRYFIGKAARHSLLTHLTVVIAVPYGINRLQRRAVEESAYRAGAQNVRIIFEPIASALGVGLPVGEPEASMIVDIGGGTTEVAVLSLGGIVAAKSLNVAGDELERAIIEYIKTSYDLVISERTAEELKKAIGSAVPLRQEMMMDIKGRDLFGGLPRALTVNSEEIRNAMLPCFSKMEAAICDTLSRCTPEISGNLYDRGAVLAGGGALIRGLDVYFAEKTGLPFFVAEDPLHAVVNGTGISIEDDNWNKMHRRD
ncbi:MAG: rod shape-determining protein [Opitutae bacterium]|nr:rod shape-determining protein [Opitutae bacterium]MCD8299245.1 rod shape-determining protein [Opitutae bacterium]